MACRWPKQSSADPEFRKERARKGGLASTSLDSYVNRVIKRAPELTEDQRSKLAAALQGQAES